MGEQFLNFPLDLVLRTCCGIVEQPYLAPKGTKELKWLAWTRCMMGLKCSPYIAIKQTHLAMEFVDGIRDNVKNPLRWARMGTHTPELSRIPCLQPPTPLGVSSKERWQYGRGCPAFCG